MRKKHKENIIFENVLVEDFAAEAKCISRVEDKVIFIDYLWLLAIMRIYALQNLKKLLRSDSSKYKTKFPLQNTNCL
jgi:hypothetical protein